MITKIRKVLLSIRFNVARICSPDLNCLYNQIRIVDKATKACQTCTDHSSKDHVCHCHNASSSSKAVLLREVCSHYKPVTCGTLLKYIRDFRDMHNNRGPAKLGCKVRDALHNRAKETDVIKL